MFRRPTTLIATIALALAGLLTIAGCTLGGANSTTTTGVPPAGGPPPNAAAPSVSQGPGYWGPGYWGPGMMNGSGGWGPGMMGGQGQWGPGMMGRNYWLPGNGSAVRTLDQARQRANAFADQLGLRVGDVMQFSWNFYAELQTPNGQPATEALVDPASGAVGIEYGPAMMWNTTYGMHRTGPTQTHITAAQATDIANRWLRDHNSALTVADPEAYPGYYTLDTLDGGKVSSMLSVNASTGAVWYHTWHGTYIATSRQ